MAPPSGERDRPGKLFLGSLSFNTDEDKIRSVFSKYGDIETVHIVKDKASNVSRGFGFVTYVNPADADDAIGGLNGTELDGKSLKVSHALKSRSSESRGGGDRGGDRGTRAAGGYGGFSRGSSRGRGSRDSFDSRGRGRGAPPLLDSGVGRGGSRRGRGGPPRGLLDDEEYGSSRAPPPRSARPSPYGREDDLDGRRPAAGGYERKSRFEDLDPLTDRSARPPASYGRQSSGYDGLSAARDARLPASSYGRDPDGYGALSAERSSRPALASYDREPAAYGREAPVYGREDPAYDRLPAERESAPRHSLLEDPYTARTREPALSDYPASRPAAREYAAVERPARTELARDPYARDPYTPVVAREPAVTRDYERARELPAAPRERDAYSRPAYPVAAPREPAGRAGLPPARSLDTGDYDRPVAREYPSERNGSYAREREPLDPYAATAGASRYDSYPVARDAYAAAPLAEKPAYGARGDPYGAAPAGRSAYSRR